MSAAIETFDRVRFDPEDAVSRLGMIALSTDLTFERDAARLLPPDEVALHVSRIAFRNPTTPANLRAMLPDLGAAADLLVPGAELAAICFGCTSAGITLGDAAVEAAIAQVRPGVPVVTPGRAAIHAFAALGVRRIALVAPYLRETTEPVAAYFRAAGLDVVQICCLDVADDRDIARLSKDTILSAALEADTPEADAIFMSCTAMPATGLVTAIEARLGKPMVTSNQASLWRMLDIAGRSMPTDLGALGRTDPVRGIPA